VVNKPKIWETPMPKWVLILLASVICGCSSGGSQVVYITPTPFVENALEAVTCPSPGRCIAVGWSKDYTKGLYSTLIEENTGSGWKIVSSPGLTTGLGSRLYGVACATPGRCIAVGQTQDLASRSKTLILENAGNSWTIVPSPNAIAFGLDTGRLVGIACPRPADCLAVGGYEVETGNYHTLIEENAGQGWEVITSPNAERGDSDLSQITCPTATQCLAVGSIAVENNGQGWVVGTYPTKGSLSAVSCVASERCIGVGGESLGGFPPVLAPLIFDKSDQNWTISSEGGVLGWLNSVTCQTANHCIAVGENDSYGALIEEQRGEGWKIVDTSTFAGNVKLSGVTCPSATHCIAVGEVGHEATAIADDIGSGWTLASSPNVGPAGAR